jgi:hypothetical protein
MFDKLADNQVIESYGLVLAELRRRGIIRSKNVLGDLGEHLVINHYKNTAGLPNLHAAPPSTQNVDALSKDGKRYSIKSTTGNVTGVFYGLPPQGSLELPEKNFEFVVIAKFNGDYILEKIIEISWDQFLSFKKWHSTMKAWNLTVSRQLVAEGKLIYSRD